MCFTRIWIQDILFVAHCNGETVLFLFIWVGYLYHYVIILTNISQLFVSIFYLLAISNLQTIGWKTKNITIHSCECYNCSCFPLFLETKYAVGNWSGPSPGTTRTGFPVASQPSNHKADGGPCKARATDASSENPLMRPPAACIYWLCNVNTLDLPVWSLGISCFVFIRAKLST
jgi:hypothetical protein